MRPDKLARYLAVPSLIAEYYGTTVGNWRANFGLRLLSAVEYWSPMPLEMLTRPRLVEALNLLGELAEQEEVTLELCIYGGSAMMLAYGARETTKDLDVIARPSDIVDRLAQIVAERLSLDQTWLNKDVRRFVSDQGTFAPLEIQELETAADMQKSSASSITDNRFSILNFQ